MSEDEEDYMSDKFLAGNTVVTGLITNRAKKREVQINQQQTERIKRQKQERLERTGANRNEILQESLKRPIESENKGFQLLAKMGYKVGQPLGKETTGVNNSSTSKALLEPIGISIKTDRGGLGREAALKELTAKRQHLREQRLLKHAGGESVTIEEYRKRATQKAEERFTQSALRRCQMSCENLDTEHQVETPAMQWFWPERIKEDNKESDEEQKSNEEAQEQEQPEVEEYSSAEKLEMLINYLRTSYQFCFWCGTHYKDHDDLIQNCPGLTRDEH